MSAWFEALRRPSITNEPPTKAEQWRNDVLVILVAVVAVVLAWLIRNSVLNASQDFPLGGQLPVVEYPAGWIKQNEEGLLLQVVDPTSRSTFDARLQVFARDLKPDENLASIGTTWPLQRGSSLQFFRHLRTETRIGPDGQPMLLISYAYVADPTRASGGTGLPVVVRADDLVFVANDGAADRLIVVTGAADAAEWPDRVQTFQKIFEGLGMQGGEQ
jgi:hypothetical protein